MAIALIGTLVGSCVVGKPADVFGRKNVLFALAACYFVSAAGCGLAQLVGVSDRPLHRRSCHRWHSVVTPMYIARFHRRICEVGGLVMVNQLNIVLGILLGCVSNYVVARYFPFRGGLAMDAGGVWHCLRRSFSS